MMKAAHMYRASGMHASPLRYSQVFLKRRCTVTTAAWTNPEPLAQPSISSIADVQRQMEQQMDALMGFGGSSFEDRLDRQFREMDRQLDRAFADMDKMQRQLDADLARSMQQLQQQEPGVHIERREERSSSSNAAVRQYRYYESISIRSGGMTAITPAHTQAPAMFSPLLFAVIVLAGAYAAVTAAFNRNYELTTYKRDSSRWKLLLLWPVLFLFNKSFRHQMGSALRGEKVRVTQSMDDGSSSPAS